MWNQNPLAMTQDAGFPHHPDAKAHWNGKEVSSRADRWVVSKPSSKLIWHEVHTLNMSFFFREVERNQSPVGLPPLISQLFAPRAASVNRRRRSELSRGLQMSLQDFSLSLSLSLTPSDLWPHQIPRFKSLALG